MEKSLVLSPWRENVFESNLLEREFNLALWIEKESIFTFPLRERCSPWKEREGEKIL